MTMGVTPRVHGNHGKRPHNRFSLDIYQQATAFLQTYIQRIRVPHSSSVSVSGGGSCYLPADVTCKTVHAAYKEYMEHFEPGTKWLGYSTFRQFLKRQFPLVKFTVQPPPVIPPPPVSATSLVNSPPVVTTDDEWIDRGTAHEIAARLRTGVDSTTLCSPHHLIFFFSPFSCLLLYYLLLRTIDCFSLPCRRCTILYLAMHSTWTWTVKILFFFFFSLWAIKMLHFYVCQNPQIFLFVCCLYSGTVLYTQCSVTKCCHRVFVLMSCTSESEIVNLKGNRRTQALVFNRVFFSLSRERKQVFLGSVSMRKVINLVDSFERLLCRTWQRILMLFYFFMPVPYQVDAVGLTFVRQVVVYLLFLLLLVYLWGFLLYISFLSRFGGEMDRSIYWS